MPVFAANRGRVVYHYRRLRALARTHRVGFRSEGTVMDGAPIFNLFQETLLGAHVLSFEGILNSTSNFILSEMEAGRTYAAGVAGAKERGIPEADPAKGPLGWDLAVEVGRLRIRLVGGHL